MRKKPSTETLNFIENIVVRHGLEKDLVENDPVLEKNLQSAESPEERRVAKFLHSQKIKECLALKRPIEEVSASVAIVKIIEKLINKEITFNDLGEILKSALEKLNIDPKIIEEVSQAIKNNEEIIWDFTKEDGNEDYSAEENSSSLEQKGKIPEGISQELL